MQEPVKEVLEDIFNDKGNKVTSPLSIMDAI